MHQVHSLTAPCAMIAQVETIYLGDRRIQIRTSVLEEKSTACNMLCCYADELKEGFLPWVQQVCACHSTWRSSFMHMPRRCRNCCTHRCVAQSEHDEAACQAGVWQSATDGTHVFVQVTAIMVPLLKFYFHEDVRIAAVQSLPELLRSATLAVEKGSAPDASMPRQMLDFFWQPFLDAMHKVCSTIASHHTTQARMLPCPITSRHPTVAADHLFCFVLGHVWNPL